MKYTTLRQDMLYAVQFLCLSLTCNIYIAINDHMKSKKNERIWIV